MLRLANTTACAKVIFILPEGEIPAERKIKKTAQQSWSEVEHVFIHACDLMQHIPDGYTLIGVETVENSKNIFSYTLPSSLALMVGNEKHGIEPAGINLCEQTVHIPLTGKCTSLNVSHALCVALFEWVRQFVVS
jgi:TrmH family RNA methyltransferase